MSWDKPWQRWMPVVAMSLALALLLLGVRGLWDPDEGRYSNVALTMLDDGDWLDTMRSGEVGHWTKPPLTYWMIAGSVATFGHTAFAARLPMALCYLSCVLLTALCARRLQPGSEHLAATVYASMLLPFGAAQWISTDAPLAASQALAMWAYVEYRFGPRPGDGRWILLVGGAFGLAFLAKGPPGLATLPAVAALAWWAPLPVSKPKYPWYLAAGVLFAGVALPWFVLATLRHPGLIEYLLGAEVVDRVATDRFDRFGTWWGWIIYLPTLLIGSLPWTWDLLRWGANLPSAARRWRMRPPDRLDAAALLIALWILVPLAIFCAARSRLPLYLLPLFLPIALVIAAERRRRERPTPHWQWLAAWTIVLLGLRLAAAQWPTHKDASAWAEAIRRRAGTRVSEVIFVDDMARYGLHLHLGVEVEKVSSRPRRDARFNPEFDETLARELRDLDAEPDMLFITPAARWPDVQHEIEALGYRSRSLGTPYRDRILFRVIRASPKPRKAEAPQERGFP